ncbi:ATP:cob(I)alamin adenosyltransferase [Candidatus Peribacteria bacterium RIFCSPHIGHO2_01_FULL_51_9]|nr:MAG: ATP:cob(I)alamin adenosyltransferase [Candidatus Peribacteria bacterium RIFCSPHIGHO2_01_FULL_51_9]
MGIVTKTGDGGTTALYGRGRVSKCSKQLHAYGTIDELNALIGLVLVHIEQPMLQSHLTIIQHMLFRVGADLATPHNITGPTVQRIRPEDIERIEKWITDLEKTLPPQRAFLLPSGSLGGSFLHYARTVCRRAERWIVALAEEEPLNQTVRVFVNRLGDYLFLLARKVNKDTGGPEVEVQYDK